MSRASGDGIPAILFSLFPPRLTLFQLKEQLNEQDDDDDDEDYDDDDDELLDDENEDGAGPVGLLSLTL